MSKASSQEPVLVQGELAPLTSPCQMHGTAKGLPRSLIGSSFPLPMPSRPSFASFALICISALASTSSASRAAVPDKPNFIVINIDDLGYADIGPFGSTLNRTPHLDKMAAQGMKLTSFYAAPVCSPSRASLMTGCYPKRVLPIPSVLFPGAALGLSPEEMTVAKVLKSVGYKTACIGKWHLGDQAEFLPNQHGFDSYFGIPYSNDMGTAAEGSKSSLGEPLPHPNPAREKQDSTEPSDGTGLRGATQPPLPLLRDSKVIERVGIEGQQSITQRYTEEALHFIKTQKDAPFFLYLPHTAVHFPIYPGRNFQHQSPNGIYSDWVEEVDWSVGQILDTLRALKLDSKTLVLFTSDNGGTQKAKNIPLHGFKASTWEGGMRVPTIVWWPGQIAAGSRSEEITGMIDVLPTFASLSGGSLPKRKIDGANIWPLLAGEKGAKSPHENAFYYFRGLKLEAVRSGDWKLQLSKPDGGGKAPSASGSPNAAPQYPRLYNLAQDIAESSDVSSEHPELVKKLNAIALKMKDDLGLDGIGPGCRAMGRVSNPKVLISADGKILPGFD